MVRKFLLTSAVIFWPKGSCIQVAVAVMVSMFFLAFHVHHMPFESAMDNWFQALALVGLLLVYFMGLLIKVQPDLEHQYGFGMLLQLVTAVVGMIVLGVPMLQKAAMKWRQRAATAKRDDGTILLMSSWNEDCDGVEMTELFHLDETSSTDNYHLMSDGH
jgi:divalent metal cation (Fe/Co/Zn/Cd) transporter